MDDKVLVPVERLQEFCVGVLMKAGLGEQSAAAWAESMLSADLRGVSSHGIVRLTSYVKRVSTGAMNLDPEMHVEQDCAASALINAQNGPGPIAGVRGMALAIVKAKSSGVGLVGVKNSSHFGVAAYYAMKALPEDMIGIVATNASPAIAPFGTKTPLLGTNPLAVAIPAYSQLPIVLDMSTSVVARGKIRLAAVVGSKIPFGWARDAEGQPTEDAAAALKGSMEPIAGAKGSGLALVIDLLCGVLTGSSLTGEVRGIPDTTGPMKTAHMFLAINIAAFANVEQFKRNIDEVIVRIKSLPTSGQSSIFLPGEIEFELERKRRLEGIPLAANVLKGLAELGRSYGVPEVCAGSTYRA